MNSGPTTRSQSTDSLPLIVEGSDRLVRDSVAAMEGEMTMIEEFYQRMAALMAQNESNLLAKIEELARKTDEQARTNNHRLDRLEEHLHVGQGVEDEAAQTSGLEAPLGVTQRLRVLLKEQHHSLLQQHLK